MNYLSIPAYAKELKVTPEYIRQLIAKGKITKSALKKKGTRWTVNPARANRDLKKNISYVNQRKTKTKTKTKKSKQNRKNKNPDDKSSDKEKDDLSLAEAQKIAAQYKAKLTKLEYKEKSGKLTNVEDVKKAAFNKARQVRDTILGIPDRISAIIAAESNVSKVKKIMIKELRQALEVLSK
jgi:hypothetical protein